MAAEWTRVARSEDIPDGEALVVELDGEPVALFRAEGRLYALCDTCPHENWSLGEDGHVEGTTVTCGGHGWQFDLRTGRCLYPRIGTDTTAYAVKVEDGEVYLRPR